MDAVGLRETAGNAVRKFVRRSVPGLQYTVVDARGIQVEFAGGLSDIANRRAMTSKVTQMAYSMTKTFTAIALLQLVERGEIALDDTLDRYLPDTPYRGAGIVIRQLLNHTSGIPNPVPLRWVHLVEEHASFNEDQALAAVLRSHPKVSFRPGRRFAYSNIGYWLVGKIIEQVTKQPYATVVKDNILARLGLSPQEMNFVIPNANRHAKGYLAKYSVMNFAKGFVTDRKYWGKYEGHWLHLKSHYLNGPAFGGLIGSARAFTLLLQDQLRAQSVLLAPQTKNLLETQQTNTAGQPIPMTLGWHRGQTRGLPVLYKEGGGGGFHSEMRIYPTKHFASIVMVNATAFNSTKFLNRMDAEMMG